jgi:hypothetical protein
VYGFKIKKKNDNHIYHFTAMGCFGSAGSKQPDTAGGSSEDTKSQKRRSDAITKQLQKDKQVRPHKRR